MNRLNKQIAIVRCLFVAAPLVGIAVGFLLSCPGKESQSPSRAEKGAIVANIPVSAIEPETAAKPGLQRCIFAEHGIGPGCRYDDRFMAKVGRDGVKAYGSAEVNTEDNVGN